MDPNDEMRRNEIVIARQTVYSEIKTFLHCRAISAREGKNRFIERRTEYVVVGLVSFPLTDMGRESFSFRPFALVLNH